MLLFNDMLVIAGKDAKGIYHLHSMIPMIAVRVEDMTESESIS